MDLKVRDRDLSLEVLRNEKDVCRLRNQKEKESLEV